MHTDRKCFRVAVTGEPEVLAARELAYVNRTVRLVKMDGFSYETRVGRVSGVTETGNNVFRTRFATGPDVRAQQCP